MFLSYDTVEAFAANRNPTLSFPFLKENGELLSLAANSGFLLEPRALDLYADVYENALKIVQTYPQYYRFILAIAQDLEALGIEGNMGSRVADFVTSQHFVEFDTSDCRRLEALFLLSQTTQLTSDQIDIQSRTLENVDRFISRPGLFTKFNKPLFYELTHFVFFLTDYGRKASPLTHGFKACLMHMGVLSLLDNDADLLAEVCLCLSFIKADIPAYWKAFLEQSYTDMKITFSGTVASALNPSVDEYHLYFVLNWYRAHHGKSVFDTKFNARTPSFSCTATSPSVLSKLSEYLHGHIFSKTPSHVSYQDFEGRLNETEQAHWLSSLQSTEGSRQTLEGFTNLRQI